MALTATTVLDIVNTTQTITFTSGSTFDEFYSDLQQSSFIKLSRLQNVTHSKKD